MSDLQARIDTLLEVVQRWLSDENDYLLQAVHQTVEEGYFSFGDVQFSLKALKQSLARDALETWVRRSGAGGRDARNMNVLCLHAGNLPLVGFQDALAVLLSGARYSGKISRKDPYLLPSFLNEVKKTALWSSVDVQWTHRLDDFEGMRNDAILFAGSERSVPEVKEAIVELHLAGPETGYLIRTAHFSMAYLDRKEDADLQRLVEAILRYGGMGCRSVAVVVSPYSLGSLNDRLQPVIQRFLEENPQHRTPKPRLRQRIAYNAALERSQLVTDAFILQENGLELDQNFICYWVQGEEDKVSSLAGRFGARLQGIYVTHPDVAIRGLGEDVELERLARAQQPPIYWKPDGTDILQWLNVRNK